ncbi:MAG: prepilin-type N-terminal cleavage/methylation domain-containing protein [Candidatus Hydrogenedentes bacterium]|nr:prepilin-type N-terminal cleavage/methylation domain-containing protein [Candidatus Hydrogenedentota bacterium]
MSVNPRHNSTSRGITLVELLVVMAIVSLLAAISIPTFATLGGFLRSDLQNASRDLYSVLRAARIYATTFHVDTAVVYSLDNYAAASNPGLAAPVIDSLDNNTVRVIIAAATFFKVPTTLAGNSADVWLPVPGDGGNFRTFPGDCVLLLRDPATMSLIYTDLSPLPNSAAGGDLRNVLGMQFVPAQLGNQILELPAHIFNPRGSINAAGERERFELLVAPPPDVNLPDRLNFPETRSFLVPNLETSDPSDLESNLISIPVELYRSTGRIKVVTE